MKAAKEMRAPRREEKMKKKKHLLKVLLAALLCVTQIPLPVTVSAADDPQNLAFGSTVTVSGLEVAGSFTGDLAVDGDREDSSSRWSSGLIPSSEYSDGTDQWIALDLGSQQTFNRIELYWEASAGIHYSLQGSNDGRDWETFYETEDGDGGLDSISLSEPVTYQNVRLYITYGNGRYSSVSLYEIELYHYTDEMIAQASLDALEVPGAVKEDFALAESDGSVAISWTSNNSLITIDNGTAVVSEPAENTWVELTATAVYGSAELRKTFRVMVMTPDAMMEDYVIYPTPQSLTMNYDVIQLTDTINVIYGDEIDDTVKARVEEVLDEHGYAVEENSADETLTKFYVGVNGTDDEADTYAADNGISTDIFDDSTAGYDKHILSINGDNSILVLGEDSDAAYYAMASLDQILKQTTGGAVTTVLIEDYADTEYRGIVEGYYGIPFSVEDRLSIFEYMKDYKMNMFTYGPKGDPYHLGNWMEDYPASVTDEERAEGLITQDDIRSMTSKAAECNVDFVWSSHPAMLDSIDFSTEAGVAAGVEALMTKFEHMYDLGVRQFAIFVDDIDLTVAYNQRDGHAQLLNDVWHALEAEYNGESSTAEDQVKPLYFVPSFYALNFGNASSRNTYLQTIGAVDEDILIGFTGTSVFSSVSSSSMRTFADLVNRDPVMWWNYPVNDGDDDELFMEPLGTPYGSGRTFTVENNITNLGGLLSNPMNQAESSKVAFFGVADYSWNTGAFDAADNWEASFTSYSDDPEIQAAIRTFASYSAAQYDGAGVTGLFDAYQNAAEPANSADIRAKMEALIDACDTLLALEGGEDTSLSNLADEIAPWARKLRDMASIINDCLIVLEAEDPAAEWSTFTEANMLYNELTNNPDYMVDSVEGQGSAAGASPVQYEAMPANTYVRPFADYIIEEARDAFTLPQRGDAEVITNAAVEAELAPAVTEDSAAISGADSILLQPEEYVGINFKAIEPIESVSAALSEGLVLQGSVNGKEWAAIEESGDTLSYAYVRVKNMSDEPVEFDLSSFSVNMTERTRIVDGTSSVSIYQSYYMTNTYDGNYETYAWTAANQAVGDTMTWTLNHTVGIEDVTFTFTGSDPISGGAVIEISEDGSEWTEIGSTTRDYLTANNYQYTCDGEGQEALYVRMRITSLGTNAWLRLYEVEVNKEANEQLARPIAYVSDGSSASAAGDRDISTYYAAGSDDTLTYQLIDNVHADEITILYSLGEETDGSVEAFITCDDGEVSLGTLDGSNTTFDVSQYRNIKNVLLKTDGQSITVFDIYETGSAYEEAKRADLTAAINNVPEKEESAYTADSWAAYETALSNANLFVNGAELSQTEADALTAALMEAISGLVEEEQPETVNKDELFAVLHEYGGLKSKDYTAETWAPFYEAYNAASAVYEDEDATQEEVDAAVAQLRETGEALVPAQTGEEEEPGSETPGGETPGAETPGTDTPKDDQITKTPAAATSDSGTAMPYVAAMLIGLGAVLLVVYRRETAKRG